jgi:predicted lipase
MSRIKRRQFLQFAGSTLVTLGLSQFDVKTSGNSLGRVLAQSTPRKSLLLSINTHLNAPLNSSVADVYLQQLVSNRFGFNPKDILILTDGQGILRGSEEHLIKQAKAGDVVVYYYSGHGSQVRAPDCDVSDCINSTFGTVDSRLSNSR